LAPGVAAKACFPLSPDVCNGSEGDIALGPRNVRFTSESGHFAADLRPARPEIDHAVPSIGFLTFTQGLERYLGYLGCSI
jgi:hypothetical protein